jgi:hypothetical protein
MLKYSWIILYVILTAQTLCVHAEKKSVLSADYYFDQYGIDDVQILNFSELYSMANLWGAATFVENGSLWAMLTGKHKRFSMFNGLEQRPNHGPKVLSGIAREKLPLIHNRLMLPETTIRPAMFEYQCHWRTAQGATSYGFLSADQIKIEFFAIDIADSSGLANVQKRDRPTYSLQTIAYQWLSFDSKQKCADAIVKMKRTLATDFVFVESHFSERYAKFFALSGRGRQLGYLNLVKDKSSENGKYYYRFNSASEDTSLQYYLSE